MKRKVFILLLIIILFSNKAMASDSLLTVAGDESFPPYEYVDDDGVFKGFNVDIMKAIAIVSDTNFNYAPMPWEEVYTSISTGKADIIQGMKKSPEREKEFLFSDPILNNSQSIFVKQENYSVFGLDTLADKRVALNIYDSNYNYYKTIKEIEIVEYDSFEEALIDLSKNQVDALVGNTLTINHLSNKLMINEDIKIVGNQINESDYCIVVEKGNQVLINDINKSISTLKENGMYDYLLQKWFGKPVYNVKDRQTILLKIFTFVTLAMTVFILFKENQRRQLKETVERISKEQKELAKELRRYDKLEFMDKIVSSLAHEIRNPLTSVKLYVGQLDKKLEDKNFLKSMSDDIPEEIERIDKLITDFLGYSTPRIAKLEKLNLKEEIQNSFSLLHLQLKKVNIKSTIGEDIYIEFDKNQLKQVLFNIILNAIDALNKVENPTIRIWATEFEEVVRLTISDNGIGVEQDQLDIIFDPFYTTKNSGNGLGLFVVKELIKENNGAISIQSQGINQGTRVTIDFVKGI